MDSLPSGREERKEQGKQRVIKMLNLKNLRVKQGDFEVLENSVPSRRVEEERILDTYSNGKSTQPPQGSNQMDQNVEFYQVVYTAESARDQPLESEERKSQREEKLGEEDECREVTPMKRGRREEVRETLNSSSVKKQQLIDQYALTPSPSRLKSFRQDLSPGMREKQLKMDLIINAQLEAQYQKSINKIIEGKFKNQILCSNDRTWNQKSDANSFKKGGSNKHAQTFDYQFEDQGGLRFQAIQDHRNSQFQIKPNKIIGEGENELDKGMVSSFNGQSINPAYSQTVHADGDINDRDMESSGLRYRNVSFKFSNQPTPPQVHLQPDCRFKYTPDMKEEIQSPHLGSSDPHQIPESNFEAFFPHNDANTVGVSYNSGFFGITDKLKDQPDILGAYQSFVDNSIATQNHRNEEEKCQFEVNEAPLNIKNKGAQVTNSNKCQIKGVQEDQILEFEKKADKGSPRKSIISGPSYISDDIASNLLQDESYIGRKGLQAESNVHSQIIRISDIRSPLEGEGGRVNYPQTQQKGLLVPMIVSGSSSSQNSVRDSGNHPALSQMKQGQEQDSTHSRRGTQKSLKQSQSGSNLQKCIQSQSHRERLINNLPATEQDQENLQEDAMNSQFKSETNSPQIQSAIVPHESPAIQIQINSARGSKMGTLVKKQSLLARIKREKKENTLSETLVRQFNLKMFDKVIAELRRRETGSLDVIPEDKSSFSASHSQKSVDRGDAARMGKFLFSAKGIDKQMIGYFFGENKQLNKDCCKEFLRNFSFKSISIDVSWRMVFTKTGLPKEGQQICRVIDIFQEVYLEQNSLNPKIQGWEKDTVWSMSVKILDLNTNLHNPNVKEMLKYSKETFVQQCQKLNEICSAFTCKELSEVYDRIARNQFENKVSLHERYFGRINEMSYSLVQQGTQKIPFQMGAPRQSQAILKQSRPAKFNSKMFKEEGTIFLKYGRFGEPKKRLVFLNQDETQILWCEPSQEQKKAEKKIRKMFLKEVETVLIGSDHTPVMRRHKIPVTFDCFCMSIIGRERSLDLMIQDKNTILLWCDRIRLLIDQQKIQTNLSPQSSPNLQGQEQEEEQSIERDECPESIQYIWRNEILNNFQRYWDPLRKKIHLDKEVAFQETYLAKLVRESIISKGGLFLHFSQEERQRRSKQAKHQSSPEPHHFNLSNSSHKDFRNQNVGGCNNSLSFLGFGCFQRNKLSERKENISVQSGSKKKGLFDLFSSKEEPVTLDQLWYCGLPNLARQCLWPILIGNQLQITKQVFDSVSRQVDSIQKRILIEQTKNDELRQFSDFKAIFNSVNTNDNQIPIISVNFEQEPCEKDGRDQEGFSTVRREEWMSGDSANIVKPAVLDGFTEHMIFQFSKIDRKVSKLVTHWQQAKLIGFQSGIDPQLFHLITRDVLCQLLLHQANLSGIQGLRAEGALHSSNVIEASYVSGMDKIAGIIVLVSLRDFKAFDQIMRLKQGCFTQLSNLLLAADSQAMQKIPLHFLRHFVTEDQGQIQWRMEFFDKLFERVHPKLSQFFKGVNLLSKFYLHGWLLELFANVQGIGGLDFVLRIWDLYLLHGEPILYCVAVAILKQRVTQLSNAPMKAWLEYFREIKKIKIEEQAKFVRVEGFEDQEQFRRGIEIQEEGKNQLIGETVRIFLEFDVGREFSEYMRDMVVAEYKNEIFHRMYNEE